MTSSNPISLRSSFVPLPSSMYCLKSCKMCDTSACRSDVHKEWPCLFGECCLTETRNNEVWLALSGVYEPRRPLLYPLLWTPTRNCSAARQMEVAVKWNNANKTGYNKVVRQSRHDNFNDGLFVDTPWHRLTPTVLPGCCQCCCCSGQTEYGSHAEVYSKLILTQKQFIDSYRTGTKGSKKAGHVIHFFTSFKFIWKLKWTKICGSKNVVRVKNGNLQTWLKRICLRLCKDPDWVIACSSWHQYCGWI